MSLLRRTLYLQALAWAATGIALALVPKSVLGLLDQPPIAEPSWLRMGGVEAFGLALLMVLVGHRAEELWWWSWAFVLMTAGVAGVATLNAAFGIHPDASSVPWWAMAGISWAFTAALLVGLQRIGRIQPPE
ncbi:MAG: hypothetical protein ACRDH6_00900 [Actinomycetota bacterium]